MAVSVHNIISYNRILGLLGSNTYCRHSLTSIFYISKHEWKSEGYTSCINGFHVSQANPHLPVIILLNPTSSYVLIK